MTAGLPWYALRSKSLKEEALWFEVRQRGIPVYYPRLKVRPVNPRARKARPYFPGYMFVQADVEDTGLGVFQWMPHAMGLVCFGGEPARVPEAVIQGLRKRLDAANEAEVSFANRLRKGDRVVVRDGPLAGYEAVFDSQLDGATRVRVLVALLHDRYIAVELSPHLIDRPTRS